MKDLMDKLSSYNIFNYLLPGVVFVVMAESFTKYKFVQEEIIVGAFLYYFLGLVVSRVGSIVIEPILRWGGFLEFSEYGDYVEASRKDKLIETLSESNNMYRTFFSLFVFLSFLKVYEVSSKYFLWLDKFSSEIALVLLLSLFAFSYKKQTAYITKRVVGVMARED